MAARKIRNKRPEICFFGWKNWRTGSAGFSVETWPHFCKQQNKNFGRLVVWLVFGRLKMKSTRLRKNLRCSTSVRGTPEVIPEKQAAPGSFPCNRDIEEKEDQNSLEEKEDVNNPEEKEDQNSLEEKEDQTQQVVSDKETEKDTELDFLNFSKVSVSLPATSMPQISDFESVGFSTPRNGNRNTHGDFSDLDTLATFAIRSVENSPFKTLPYKRPHFDVSLLDREAEGIKKICLSLDSVAIKINEETKQLEAAQRNIRNAKVVLEEERQMYESEISSLSSLRDQYNILSREYKDYKVEAAAELERRIDEMRQVQDDSERNKQLTVLLETQRRQHEKHQQELENQNNLVLSEMQRLINSVMEDATSARTELRQHLVNRGKIEDAQKSLDQGDDKIKKDIDRQENELIKAFEAQKQAFEAQKQALQNQRTALETVQAERTETFWNILQEWQKPNLEKFKNRKGFEGDELEDEEDHLEIMSSSHVSVFTEIAAQNAGELTEECKEWLAFKPLKAMNRFNAWLKERDMGFENFDTAQNFFKSKYFKKTPEGKVLKYFKQMVHDFLCETFSVPLSDELSKNSRVSNFQKKLSEIVENNLSGNMQATRAWNLVFGDNRPVLVIR